MAKPLYKNLTVQVLTAIAIGVAIGSLRPEWGQSMKPLADGFLRLVKMVVGPIIFLTVVCGIASMGDMRKAGRVGIKALIYFEVITTLALAIGLLVANIVQPGMLNGRPIASQKEASEPTTSTVPAPALKSASASASPTKAKDTAEKKEASPTQRLFDFLLHVIPESPVDAFARGDLLQILFFAVLFAVAMMGLGMRDSAVMMGLEQLTKIMFKVVGIIMKVAPLGAMGAIAFTVGKFGLEALQPLAKLMACVYLTMAVFIFVGLGLVCRLFGFRLWQYLKFIREEVVLVLGTSSSESALPRMIEKLELMGCSRSVVDLVIPTGYSFNLDGTSIYLSMALVFTAQYYGVEMSLGQQIWAMVILMLTSKGAAAVTGGGFVTLSATLGVTMDVTVLPADPLAPLLGVDRFMSEARAITNLIGNGVATIVVSKMEGEFSQQRYDAAIAGHALAHPPREGFASEVMGDVASDPASVDPEVGATRG